MFLGAFKSFAICLYKKCREGLVCKQKRPNWQSGNLQSEELFWKWMTKTLGFENLCLKLNLWDLYTKLCCLKCQWIFEKRSFLRFKYCLDERFWPDLCTHWFSTAQTGSSQPIKKQNLILLHWSVVVFSEKPWIVFDNQLQCLDYTWHQSQR